MNRIVIIIFIFIFKEGGRSLLADSCQIEFSDLRAKSIFKISTWVFRCADWNITWPAGRFTVRGNLQRRQITRRLTFLALSTLLWKNIDLEHKLRGRRDGRWVQRGWNVVGIPQKLAIFFLFISSKCGINIISLYHHMKIGSTILFKFWWKLRTWSNWSPFRAAVSSCGTGLGWRLPPVTKLTKTRESRNFGANFWGRW